MSEQGDGHFCPDWVVAPGATIHDLLVEQHISERVFARIMHLTAEDVTALLAGEMTLTDGIAGRLAAVFGPSRTFWLNLERHYRAGPCRDRCAALAAASGSGHQFVPLSGTRDPKTNVYAHCSVSGCGLGPDEHEDVRA